jgi:hypothetical protein
VWRGFSYLGGRSPGSCVKWPSVSATRSTVAQASYVDPRVVEAYDQDRTIAAVLTELRADADYGQLATAGTVERVAVRYRREAGPDRR